MKRWMLLLVAALLVFSLACSVLGGDEGTTEPGTPGEAGEETPVSQATEKATEAPEEGTSEAAAEDESTPPVMDENALEGLDSYRSTWHMRMETDDGTTVEEMVFEQEAIREPPAQRMVIRGTGTESQTIEMIQIGDTQWMNFGEGGWMQTAVGEDEAGFEEGMLYSVDDFTSIATDKDYEYLGKEKVNGVRARHYRLNLNALEMSALTNGSDVDEVNAEIWVADESGLPEFPIRFVMESHGEVEEGKQGTTTLTQEVYDINAKFTIEPPEGASETGLPDDVPMYPDATELTSFAGFVSFHAADDVDTVTAFYDTELQSAGWTKGGDDFFPTWEKDGRTLQLMITANDDGGTDVMITFAE